MFDFLKGLFKEKEKKELSVNGKSISFSEVDDWINKSGGEILSNFKEKTNHNFLLMDEGIKDIERGLSELENFNIEKEMNERAKTMIIQNKDNYVKSTRRLLDFFNGGLKLERNVKNIDDFVKLALWEIDLFTRQTTRSFHISSSIIGKEFEKIIFGLKKINNSILELKNFDKTNERMIEMVVSMINDIKGDEKLIAKFNLVQKENEAKINELKKKFDGLKNKENEIKSSKEWKQKEDLDFKIKKLEEEQEKIRVELRSLFMNIEKIIQKYAWNRKKKEILMYIEDTISALREDDGLKVLNEIEEMKKDIEENIYTNDKERKNSFLESVEKINEKVLLDFLDKDMDFDERLSKLRKEFSEIKIEELDYEGITEKIGEKDEENLKIEKKKKIIFEEIDSKKKKVSLLIEDLGEKIGKPIKLGL